MRIMIVEDSVISRTMLKDMLVLLEHEVVAEADSASQAVEAYRTHKPDVVTLDLGLGRESGLDVLKAIRAVDPNAKVLVITGNPQEKLRAQTLAAGAYGFVTKPISIDALGAVVKKAQSA